MMDVTRMFTESGVGLILLPSPLQDRARLGDSGIVVQVQQYGGILCQNGKACDAEQGDFAFSVERGQCHVVYLVSRSWADWHGGRVPANWRLTPKVRFHGYISLLASIRLYISDHNNAFFHLFILSCHTPPPLIEIGSPQPHRL